MPNFTARKVATMKTPGMHSDGQGLYLCVSKAGSKSWILRSTVKGRSTASGKPYRVELGLGSTQDVSLAEARQMAVPLRKLAREGINPLDEKRKETLSFDEAARRVHQGLLPTWRSAKHGQIWLASMENHVFPKIGALPLESVGTADILRVLAPIWTETHDTARRLKQRVAAVFDWAKGAGHYSKENPVTGIRKALPKVTRRAQHMPAMAWQDLPSLMCDLSDRNGVSARTLEFLILTATRSGEARGARWNEIDNNIWTIPGSRMKSGKEHRVPLNVEAMSVLERVRGLDEELLFPSVKRQSNGRSKEQSVMVFKALYGRMGREGFSTHGFRSSFRDWCSESAKADREVAEAALAHVSGNEVERAYARSDLFDRRRELMDAWGRYATGKSGDVVQMVRA